MTPSQAAHLAVYSLLFGYLGRVVYLISERLWIAVRRFFELREIKKGFNSEPIRFRDQGLLIEAVKAEMFPKRESSYPIWDADPDYRPFMNDAAEYETEKASSKSAA